MDKHMLNKHEPRPMPADDSAEITEKRKADHIRINLEKDVSFKKLSTELESYYFMHQALPDLNFATIDTKTELLGKPLNKGCCSRYLALC
jgi:isopentenyl-diphosphate delta-isomerase